MFTRRQFMVVSTLGAAGLPLRRGIAEAVADSQVEFGVCASVSKAALLKQAGFGYVEEGVSGFLMPKATDEEFKKKHGEAGMPPLPVRACNGFIPSDMKVVGPSVDLDSVAKYIGKVFARAEEAGVTRIVFGSGGARRIPEGFPREKAIEQIVELGKRIAPLAEPRGVTVAVEPLNRKECNFINRVDECLAVVDAVGRPNFMQHADVFHMMREDEGPESLIKAGARLVHCHVATKQNRKAPGLEETDFRPYFKALKQIGYKGGISIEGGWKDFAADLPRAFRELKNQWDSA